jgi:acetyl esterase/lipase
MDMNPRSTAGRLLVGLASLAVLGGCATGASPTPAPASLSPAERPSIAVAVPSPTPTGATARTSTPPSVVETENVAYESANPVLAPGVLDIYAPAKAGSWPVVVMFHAPGWWDELPEHARQVADLGFVVFMPIWGRGSDDPPTYEQATAIDSQAACAVAFARSHAADYGGDPATMIVFGHSGGANVGAMVAFARPEPTGACLGGSTLGAIDALVTWDGDWILSRVDAGWDPVLAADPRVLEVITPWKHLAEHKDLKVVMLLSENPGVDLGRRGSDPWAADSWLAKRDPTGDLRRQIKANGAFDDGEFDVADLQQVLFSVLKAQGNPVSLDVLPDSTHEYLVGGGWKVFLAAFRKATARD